jgi:hypothetical protein
MSEDSDWLPLGNGIAINLRHVRKIEHGPAGDRLTMSDGSPQSFDFNKLPESSKQRLQALLAGPWQTSAN